MFNFTIESDINAAIENALEIAEKNAVRGKEITPFLLSRISELTKGRSLQTSILFKNNCFLVFDTGYKKAYGRNNKKCSTSEVS